MSRAYVVVRLLRKGSLYAVESFSVGQVELRPAKLDSPEEAAALEESRASFGETEEQHILSMRISTTIVSETPERAHLAAEDVFEETLDILQMLDMAVYDFRMFDAGYCRDLATGQIVFRRNSKPQPLPQTGFKMPVSEFGVADISQIIASEQTALTKQFIRHAHWLRKSRNEHNIQMRILCRWFAMEAIWKKSEDDDIVPMILWCLGFPTRDGLRSISDNLKQQLFAIPNYGTIKNELSSKFHEIKDFRNKSVHNGFRWQDRAKSDLLEFDHLTHLAAAYVKRFATDGIRLGLTTPEELKDAMPKLFEISDRIAVINNVLHGIQHPTNYRRVYGY